MKTTMKSIKYLFAMFFAFNLGLLTAFLVIYDNEEDRNTSANIINRQMNYHDKECYNKIDIELIVYGEVQ